MSSAQPVVWFEIPVSDLERSAHFYGEMFGWRFGRVENMDIDYLVIESGSLNGGLRLRTDAGANNGPFVFVAVDGLLESLERVRELGGEVEQDPTLISVEAGAYAVLRDPDGNRVGVWVP